MKRYNTKNANSLSISTHRNNVDFIHLVINIVLYIINIIIIYIIFYWTALWTLFVFFPTSFSLLPRGVRIPFHIPAHIRA